MILALLGSSVAPAAVVWTVLEVAFDVDGPFEEWQPLLPAVLVEEVPSSSEAPSLSEGPSSSEAVVLEVVEPVEPAARSFVHPLEC